MLTHQNARRVMPAASTATAPVTVTSVITVTPRNPLWSGSPSPMPPHANMSARFNAKAHQTRLPSVRNAIPRPTLAKPAKSPTCTTASQASAKR